MREPCLIACAKQVCAKQACAKHARCVEHAAYHRTERSHQANPPHQLPSSTLASSRRPPGAGRRGRHCGRRPASAQFVCKPPGPAVSGRGRGHPPGLAQAVQELLDVPLGPQALGLQRKTWAGRGSVQPRVRARHRPSLPQPIKTAHPSPAQPHQPPTWASCHTPSAVRGPPAAAIRRSSAAVGRSGLGSPPGTVPPPLTARVRVRVALGPSWRSQMTARPARGPLSHARAAALGGKAVKQQKPASVFHCDTCYN